VGSSERMRNEKTLREIAFGVGQVSFPPIYTHYACRKYMPLLVQRCILFLKPSNISLFTIFHRLGEESRLRPYL
jgi:hypothetical protein